MKISDRDMLRLAFLLKEIKNNCQAGDMPDWLADKALAVLRDVSDTNTLPPTSKKRQVSPKGT